jgi:hypothetical protein
MTSPADGDELLPSGPPAPPRPTRRGWILGGVAAALGLAGYAGWRRLTRFPPDTTPEGAYLRIVVAVSEGRVRDAFPYLDEPARHAAYSIRDYRKRASDLVAAQYPEPERTRLLDAYRTFAEAPDGADVWNEMAHKRGWITRLRRDLSGIARTETSGERVTLETARGTRYTFRRRDNGIWGLSLFTADLVAESERAARDAEVVEQAAADYARGK